MCTTSGKEHHSQANTSNSLNTECTESTLETTMCVHPNRVPQATCTGAKPQVFPVTYLLSVSTAVKLLKTPGSNPNRPCQTSLLSDTPVHHQHRPAHCRPQRRPSSIQHHTNPDTTPLLCRKNSAQAIAGESAQTAGAVHGTCMQQASLLARATSRAPHTYAAEGMRPRGPIDCSQRVLVQTPKPQSFKLPLRHSAAAAVLANRRYR